MKTVWIIVIVVVVALLLIALAAWLMRRRQRTHRLRERFGPEYDRNVEATGDRGKAEARLRRIADERDRLDIRPLSEASRSRYLADWQQIQGRFVDEPVHAVREASVLVDSVMRDRGYPVEDFDTKEGLVAADHPDVAANYRAARDIDRRSQIEGNDRATTEELRGAFVHYRSLFSELLEDQGGDDDPPPTGAGRAEVPGEATDQQRARTEHVDLRGDPDLSRGRHRSN
jgi:hypothetical protein